MITNEHVKQALGPKVYDPKTNYRVVEEGPQKAAKLAKGFEVVGKLGDKTTGGLEMYILKPPTGEK